MRVSMVEARKCAAIHRVLSNPRRLMILWLLEDRERSVGELAEAIGASLQSTSQHLRLMRERGLVGSRREGQTVYYKIEGQLSPGSALRLEHLSASIRPVDDCRHTLSPKKEYSHD